MMKGMQHDEGDAGSCRHWVWARAKEPFFTLQGMHDLLQPYLHVFFAFTWRHPLLLSSLLCTLYRLPTSVTLPSALCTLQATVSSLRKDLEAHIQHSELERQSLTGQYEVPHMGQ